MAEGKDYLGEKLRLVERAREDAYFRKLDQDLIERMRQQETTAAEEATRLSAVFDPILVPVDFSPYSAKALLCAADIAERFASALIVLHVLARETAEHATQRQLEERGVQLPGASATTETSEVPDEVIESIVADHRERAYTELLEFLPPHLARHPLELRVVVGHPFERILETAVREEVALIVMGTHGRTGLSRVLMGSIAERVTRLAPCPVLTVKAPTPEEESWLQGFYETFMSPHPRT